MQKSVVWEGMSPKRETNLTASLSHGNHKLIIICEDLLDCKCKKKFITNKFFFIKYDK